MMGLSSEKHWKVPADVIHDIYAQDIRGGCLLLANDPLCRADCCEPDEIAFQKWAVWSNPKWRDGAPYLSCEYIVAQPDDGYQALCWRPYTEDMAPFMYACSWRLVDLVPAPEAGLFDWRRERRQWVPKRNGRSRWARSGWDASVLRSGYLHCERLLAARAAAQGKAP